MFFQVFVRGDDVMWFALQLIALTLLSMYYGYRRGVDVERKRQSRTRRGNVTYEIGKPW